MTKRKPGTGIYSKSHPEWGEVEILETNGVTASVRYWVLAHEVTVELDFGDLEGDLSGYLPPEDPPEEEQPPDEAPPAKRMQIETILKSRECVPSDAPGYCDECENTVNKVWYYKETNKGPRNFCETCREKATERSFPEKQRKKKKKKRRKKEGGRKDVWTTSGGQFEGNRGKH